LAADATLAARVIHVCAHEPFAVEHRSHDAPGEQVEGQQPGGESDRSALDSLITFGDINATMIGGGMLASTLSCWVARTSVERGRDCVPDPDRPTREQGCEQQLDRTDGP
jgi:hypothetical protein